MRPYEAEAVKPSGTGIWSAGLAFGDAGEITEAADELDELGYTSIWFPGYGTGVFEAAKLLLDASATMTVGTGILCIGMYTAAEAASGHAELRAAHGDRFLLGLGVSHAPVVDALLKEKRYQKPLAAMTEFLDGLDSMASPADSSTRVLAALGPKMLQLPGSRTGGAHPYNVTAEHTAQARRLLGPDKLLVPEQTVALTTNVDEARRLGREFLTHYLPLANYANSRGGWAFPTQTWWTVARTGSSTHWSPGAMKTRYVRG
jgi:probable F420-dependent oxidoreductase